MSLKLVGEILSICFDDRQTEINFATDFDKSTIVPNKLRAQCDFINSIYFARA